MPFFSYSVETDDLVNVKVRGFSGEPFTLGDNTYVVEAAFDNHLSVSVTTVDTPEPATLALVPIGLAVVGFARRCRVRPGHHPSRG